MASPGLCVPCTAIVWAYSALLRGRRERGPEVGDGEELHLFISSPDLLLIRQPWEDKHVFFTVDLLLSEGEPLLGV